MFKKILIANRGEIVFRIVRTCREKFDPTIRTVGVFSDADRGMPYIKAVDEAYYIGPSEPVYSYLNIAKILEVAKVSKADAIHPGYGFLSENDLFARACEREGIKFIGPDAGVIEAMGDKTKALRIARKAGVPTPERIEWKPNGSLNRKSMYKRIKRVEDRIGYPLIVKPRGGGGGIGMRVVNSRAEMLPAIESCGLQAQKSFNNRELYFEKYLRESSHIEVQILADDVKVLHLFERDCSVQRRNQKIIEEAPSQIDDKFRERISKLAIKIVKQIKKETGILYTGAGTLEFLVDKEGNIYFIEMNMRLQVEHGVTEMIAGIDIVEWQIRVAAGERLPFKQRNIRQEGHAIEARIYPELWDRIDKLFVPQKDTIRLTRLPKRDTDNLRIDSAIWLDESYEVPIFYEGLIMKVIAKGRTREEAIKSILEALDQVCIMGASTNTDFLMGILTSETFKKGEHTTKMLEDNNVLDQIEREMNLIDYWRLTRSIQRNIGMLA